MDAGGTMISGGGPMPQRAPLWQQILGYVLAAAFLIWVFHGVHVERMFHYMGSMSWWWIVPAVVCDVMGYASDGVRWRCLLLPLGRIPVLRTTQAIYIGLFTSEVMPMRVGELVRVYLVSRWMGRTMSDIVPSLLVCRLIDGVWMAAGIGLVAMFIPLPRDLTLAGDIFGIVVLTLVVLFLMLILRESEPLSRWAKQPSGRGFTASLKRVTAGILLGLQELGEWRALTVAGLFTLGFFVLQALAFWLIMEAYQLKLPLAAGVAVYLIVRFGTTLPNAPANIGSYQFFTVLGLSIFGIEKTRATGFSVVVFIILTLPLWLLGLLSLWKSGMTLGGIRADLRAALTRKGESPASPAA